MSEEQAKIAQQELEQVNAAIMAGDYDRVKDMRFTDLGTANIANKMAEDAKATAEFQQNALGGVGAVATASTGLGFLGFGGDASNKDRAEAYEDLNRIGTISAIGGGTGTVGLAGLTQGQIAILSPGTKMAYASEADLGDLVLQAGTPQAGLAIAQAQKQQVAQETGEYRNRTTR